MREVSMNTANVDYILHGQLYFTIWSNRSNYIVKYIWFEFYARSKYEYCKC